jgi:mannose-6-phosphate isomerase-like protein (cupin superfamily)
MPSPVSPEDVETQSFPWGAIKWLCNIKTDPEANMTLGLVFINPGRRNDLHIHPNCEELLYVLSGECLHSLDDVEFPMSAGMMLRIPAGVRHSALNTGWEPVRMLVAYSSADRQTVVMS